MFQRKEWVLLVVTVLGRGASLIAGKAEWVALPVILSALPKIKRRVLFEFNLVAYPHYPPLR